MVRFIFVSTENPPLKTSLCISHQHFHSAPKQITLEIKLNKFYNRCFDEKYKIIHTAHFINTLRNNDYPTSIARRLDKKSRKLLTPSNTCFLKLPHFSEIITKEIRQAIYKEGFDIQLAHFRPSLRQYLTKKNNNTVTTCTLAHCSVRDPNIYAKRITLFIV